MGNQKEKKIGVVDSGLGGLTVVRELERLLPEESIAYFGDNANCPYGNRPKGEILDLSRAMLDFMREQGVKIVAIACNTISILAGELRTQYDFPIVSIIEAACSHAAAQNFDQIGLFATEFTVKAGLYNTLIHSRSPETKVYGVPSRTLAALVDDAHFNENAAETEIRSMLDLLLKAAPRVKHVILGCTHYPLVQELFEKAAPGLSFINPAVLHAEAVKAQLEEQGLLRETPRPNLEIFTSGEKSQYERAITKLGIRGPFTLSIIK